jgi:hypothetical protein
LDFRVLGAEVDTARRNDRRTAASRRRTCSAKPSSSSRIPVMLCIAHATSAFEHSDMGASMTTLEVLTES